MSIGKSVNLQTTLSNLHIEAGYLFPPLPPAATLPEESGHAGRSFKKFPDFPFFHWNACAPFDRCIPPPPIPIFVLKSFEMTSLVFTAEKKSSLKRLTEIAQQLGIRVSTLTIEEMEDLGLLRAMRQAENDKRVSTKNLVANLRKRADENK